MVACSSTRTSFSFPELSVSFGHVVGVFIGTTHYILLPARMAGTNESLKEVRMTRWMSEMISFDQSLWFHRPRDEKKGELWGRECTHTNEKVTHAQMLILQAPSFFLVISTSLVDITASGR